MRVCQYIPHGAIPDVRGFAPAIVAQQLYQNFSSAIDHYFVSNQEHYAKKFVDDKNFGKIFRIKEGFLYKKIFQKITRLDPYPLHKRLAKIINENDIDILHVHQLEFPIKEFKKFINNKNIKIILHVHAIRNFNENRGVANCYLAVSNYTKHILINEQNYPINLVEVLYNGVDTQLFHVRDKEEIQTIKDFYNISHNEIILTYVGRKQQSKGFYNFLRTVKFLLDNTYNIFAFSVGSTPPDTYKDENYEEECTLLNQLSQNNHFRDLSPLQHNELSKIYKVSDIVLFPTYFKGEQHPLVALEAISSNTILVSSNMFSLGEIIQDNQNGFLIHNPKDNNEIIKKIIYIIKNIANLQYIRDNAYETAVSKFDWQISTCKLEKIYQSLLKGHR